MFKNVVNKNKLLICFGFVLMVNQAFGQYTIQKYTINSGGEKMAGSGFEMNASIGQHDASSRMSAGNFSMNGGFWHENNDLIFKNGFE